jgi:hypothetical protein
MWTQKNVKIMSIFLKKDHQMNNLLAKYIETFLMSIFKILKVLNDVIVINFYP